MWFFRALALDLDGTLAVADRVSAEVLSALDDVRKDRAVLLVTGRVERDLDRVFPGLVEHFDAVVTENGAVLTRPGASRETRLLHEPVDLAVDKALADRGVATDRGQVLLAIDGRDATAAHEVIAELGLDHQVVHNRCAAMILPAGVTKGSGLRAALDALGLSAHNSLAVGDAENDLTLVRVAEVGVAVANAVPSLSAYADLVLDHPDGLGVADLLRSPLVAGRQTLWPPRRMITIGTLDDGYAASVPGSQASVLITGESATGKSYLAGLLAERWIERGYSVLVIDPEGDHVGLAERPDVHLVDGSADPPRPHRLLALLRPHQASVVLDLSALDAERQLDYLQRLSPAIAAERSRHGLPHWVVYDEAHQQAWLDQGNRVATGPGSCLVTWRPELIDAGSVRAADVIIHTDPARVTASSRGPVRATLDILGTSRTFVVAERGCSHVRHQHKYATTPLPRPAASTSTGRTPPTSTPQPPRWRSSTAASATPTSPPSDTTPAEVTSPAGSTAPSPTRPWPAGSPRSNTIWSPDTPPRSRTPASRSSRPSGTGTSTSRRTHLADIGGPTPSVTLSEADPRPTCASAPRRPTPSPWRRSGPRSRWP
jgi:HAD superfamily hydrolase (TIGR01484 family)